MVQGPGSLGDYVEAREVEPGLSGGERVKGLLLRNVGNELEGRPNVFQGEIVFALTSSNVIPPAKLPTTSVAGIRVPEMTGCQMTGSMTMRSRPVMP
jgi:hypothetical protein